MPVPERATDWGELAALSTKSSVALKAPVDLGLKTTETVQVALMAREDLQLVVLRKEVGLTPSRLMAVMARGAEPVFLRVTFCKAEVEPAFVEGKERLAGEGLAAGTPMPVPVRATD